MYQIRIFQPDVRPYRVGLFSGVAAKFVHRVTLCAAPCFDDNIPCLEVAGVYCDYNHPIVSLGGLDWQKGFTLKGLRRGDVVVVCGGPRNLAMMWIAIKARFKGIGVVWWGLHKMPSQKRCNLILRKWIMKTLSNTILFYNKSGIQWLRDDGYNVQHVFATGNTINQEPIKAAINKWTDERLSEFHRANNLVGKRCILACSRIIEKQRLHEAIEALAKEPLHREDTLLVVIGDGPLKTECVELSRRLGVDGRIRWLGAIYDEDNMAPWFLSAKAFTYPGPVGLAILKALSYGLPAVINDTHNSTEAEIMENGKTGLLFKEGDVDDLARVLDELMSNDARWKEMSEYSKKVAYENYSMEQMVNNYCAAIEDAHMQVAKDK